MEEIFEDMPQDVQDFFAVVNEQNMANQDKEAFDYFSLYHSNGWARLKEYIKSLKKTIAYSSKEKAPEESLESYAAKRLSADAVTDILDNLIGYVKYNAENYEATKKSK